MNEREVSIEILKKVHYDHGYASDLLSNLNIRKNDQREIAFVKRLVYGVLEEIYLLDYFIEKYSHISMNKIDGDVLEILRISIYQYLFMDKVPDYAIISEALKLAENKSLMKYKSFIDGLLRNFMRENEGPIEIDIKDKWKKMEVEYSISKDFLDLLRKNYSVKTIRKILKSYKYNSEVMIRYNPNLISKEDLMESLSKEGFILREHEEIGEVLILENSFGLTETLEFKKGYFTIQDASSVLAAYYLNPEENSTVLDLCAAPGSKTCQLAEMMKNTGRIFANDIHLHKLALIKENAERLGAKNIYTINVDGTVYQEEWEGKFDCILLDAPCSGSGIVAKKPEIKIRRKKDDVQGLVETQRKLIENALRYLKEDGILLYSTCSILEEENEEQREYILDHYPVKPVPLLYKGKERDYLKIMPYEKDQDGFFIGKFKKIQ